jgi:hypothetical protein
MLATTGPNQAYEQPRKGVARRYTRVQSASAPSLSVGGGRLNSL